MHLLAVYCNHQTADLTIRERLAFSTEAAFSRAYAHLQTRFPTSEKVVLSTCNRVEIYTAQETDDQPTTPQDIIDFLCEFHDIQADEFQAELQTSSGPDAVRHLFQVVCSLDSMVLGEPQIVNQVKTAYRRAQDNEACGPLTHALFQAAINVSKRVRTETGLAEGRVSVASVAVGTFGRDIFGRFDDKTVLIIGAGEMAEETVQYLRDEGVGQINVVNRSFDRAQRLAESLKDATAHPYEELDRWLAEADIVVSTTGADRPIMDVERFRSIRADKDDRPIFIIDLGAPRDFEPGIGEIDENVFLYDIDDLQAVCERNRKGRKKEIEKALAVVDTETTKFMGELHHRATGPIVKRLRERWHDISQDEVKRLRSKLSHLDENDMETVERSIERIVNKLLHPPLETLREEARGGTPHGLLDALKQLFNLGD